MSALLNINNFYVDIISIGIIICIIIAMIVGAARGFLKELVSFGKVFLVLGCAIFLCKPLGDLIFKTGLGRLIANPMEQGLINKSSLMGEIVTSANRDMLLSQGISAVFNVGFIAKIVTKMVSPFVTLDGGLALANYTAVALTTYIMRAFAFILIVLLGSLVVVLVNKLAKAIHKLPVLGAFDRLLGLALSAFVCYIIIDAALYGISLVLINTNWGVSKWLVETLYLEEDNVFTLGKFMMQNSLIKMLIQTL